METNAEAYLYYDATKENTWVDAVLNSLGGKKHNYYKVASLQLVTVLIIIVARTEHQPFITEVDTRYCGVGIMNRLGNKGGCSVRFRFHDSYFCFVASHLAAFVSNCDRRNQDFTEICKKILFNHQIDKKTEYVHHSWNSGGDEGVTFLDRNGVTNDWSKQASIFHADHVIWLGDLNYRVNLTRTEVNAKLNQDEYQDLLEYDQLSIERQAGRAFSMFEEGPINFFPTYRYDAGTNQYDTSPKKRVPSWTDRILWKKPMDHNKPTLTQLSYDDCMEMMLSDHKPVQALFDIKVRDINVEKQSETKQKLIHQLIETPDDITKGTLSSSYVSFDDVQFMEFKERNLILENTGKAVAPFRFIPKMDEPQVCPNWLQVYPLQGVIGPGEKVVLHFEIMIDSSMSAPFNEGKQEIKDILVLRLENGKDFFIDINGKYIPTCFGMKLDQLAQMTVPIQEVISSSRDQREQSKSSNDSNQNQQQQQLQQQVNLPKELWRMLTFLWNKNMLSMEDLFLSHGDRVISDYIRKCLDSGDTFDTAILLGETSQDINENEDDDSDNEKSKSSESVGANSMVDVLIAFLDCLPEPVIPTSFYSRALAAADSNDLIKALKEDLPYLHLNVLLYITSFLNYAIDYAPESCKEERREHIVTSFTVLLKPGLDFKEKNPALAEQTKQRFISRLLQL
ncbi:Endonuclease/exonuclease/phosphatase [Cunninghamella echinulata]|nr:Endonuclease/exonuclease/phosphatase [Cunninghamella echinulata]